MYWPECYSNTALVCRILSFVNVLTLSRTEGVFPYSSLRLPGPGLVRWVLLSMSNLSHVEIVCYLLLCYSTLTNISFVYQHSVFAKCRILMFKLISKHVTNLTSKSPPVAFKPIKSDHLIALIFNTNSQHKTLQQNAIF